MRARRRILLSICLVLVSASVLPVRAAAASRTACSAVLGTTAVSGPTHAVAWRVAIEAPTAVFSSLPGKRTHITRWLTPTDAAWLLVIARARAAHGRCWMRGAPSVATERSRPAGSTLTRSRSARTPWRIVVSTSRRTLTLFRAGKAVRTVSVVVGNRARRRPTACSRSGGRYRGIPTISLAAGSSTSPHTAMRCDSSTAVTEQSRFTAAEERASRTRSAPRTVTDASACPTTRSTGSYTRSAQADYPAHPSRSADKGTSPLPGWALSRLRRQEQRSEPAAHGRTKSAPTSRPHRGALTTPPGTRTNKPMTRTWRTYHPAPPGVETRAANTRIPHPRQLAGFVAAPSLLSAQWLRPTHVV